jgi:hypothetical protein
LVATLDQYLTPAATFANPFPNGIQQAVGSANGVDTFLGQNVTVNNRDLKQPYISRWSFNIQRELSNNMLVEVGYLGSRGSKLTVSRDLNYVPLEFLSRSPVRDQETINRLSRVVANPFAGLLPGTGLNGGTIAAEQLLRPYPQFSGNKGVRMDALNEGRSWFHMLQARFEKRYAAGFNLLTNFQWSKMMEETNRINIADPLLEHRIADEDRPLRFVVSGTYELPFGPGKPLLGDTDGFVKRLAGGGRLTRSTSRNRGHRSIGRIATSFITAAI